MPGGKQGGHEEVVITGDAVVKRCPHRERRRGDQIEPDYGGRMQVQYHVFEKQYTAVCLYAFSISAEFAHMVSSTWVPSQ